MQFILGEARGISAVTEQLYPKLFNNRRIYGCHYEHQL